MVVRHLIAVVVSHPQTHGRIQAVEHKAKASGERPPCKDSSTRFSIVLPETILRLSLDLQAKRGERW
jgi:hypothetical protein